MAQPEAITLPMPCSRLEELLERNAFLWATGIEDTFIVDPHHATQRHLDEYELTEHYARWREDIELIASLGVRAARYGIPWYRVQPEPDRWDWSWPDQVFETMLEKGVEPIVDLVHYGVPPWLERSVLDDDLPPRMAEYASRVAQRYKGRIRWYTPLNEPRINAWYCGKLGWWPPYETGWDGFARITAQLARAIVLTHRALKDVDPEIVTVHVDATDLYTATDPGLEGEANFRQRLVFLPLDLVTGRISDEGDLADWLSHYGVSDRLIQWFGDNRVTPDIVGINLYPMFSDKYVEPSKIGGRVRIKQRYARAEIVGRLGVMYYERYGRPVMITETASTGRPARRIQWLEESLAAVRALRAKGVPLVGYTWWPLFSLVAWAYRQGRRPMSEYVLHMGLWDLDKNLDRVETAAARAFREYVGRGSESVGPLETMRQGAVYAL